ncbi:MAG: Zeta toxin [Alphaproteobacteria bacterium]|jgi:hypothetical protein|nr:Zeta toxin [Alphaproteobacteria bacterium]
MIKCVSLKKWFSLCLFYTLSVMGALGAAQAELIPDAFVKSHLKPYSDKEKELIEADLRNIADLCFREQRPGGDQPLYVATAGGPGASKSTILETFLHDHPDFVYADPDPRALKFMINTYYQSLTYYAISQAPSFQAVLRSAYEKWRAASNYIACTILNRAFADGYNIAHGTTSTAKEVAGLYGNLKAKNYRIMLLLCGSTDQNRINAIHNRSMQGFVQNAEEDTINKGKIFWERFPIYFQYADEIVIYWTEDFAKGSVKAATFDPKGGVVILNPQAYERFVNQYEQERAERRDIPSFEELIARKA